MKFNEDTDRVLEMVEERGKDEIIKLIQGASSLVSMAASVLSKSTEMSE